MNWLHYLLEANLYLGVFYLCYVLLLKGETHYMLSRAYLLLSCVVSFVLPLIQLGFLMPVMQVVQGVTYITVTKTPLSFWDIALYGYAVGAVIFLLRLLIKLYQVQQLINNNEVIVNADHKLIHIENANTAFSFFNYLFIGTNIIEAELVTRHELVHIRQKHSADIIFVELFKVINWFNPLIYLLQNSLKTLHEYIADEQTATNGIDAISYSTFLLNNAYGLSGSTITHSFFNYNLLKSRIVMLNQQRSGKVARLKYLIAIPLCAGLLCESTLGVSKNYGWITIAPQKNTVQYRTVALNDSNSKVKVVDVALKQPPPPPQPPKNQVKDNNTKTNNQPAKILDVVLTPPAKVVNIPKTTDNVISITTQPVKAANELVIMPSGSIISPAPSSKPLYEVVIKSPGNISQPSSPPVKKLDEVVITTAN